MLPEHWDVLYGAFMTGASAVLKNLSGVEMRNLPIAYSAMREEIAAYARQMEAEQALEGVQ